MVHTPEGVSTGAGGELSMLLRPRARVLTGSARARRASAAAVTLGLVVATGVLLPAASAVPAPARDGAAARATVD
uniref:hypothetical protein n=1 Tax=Aquipuribacter hungaricus TaxID=545624 RepID=UPI0030EF5C8B